MLQRFARSADELIRQLANTSQVSEWSTLKASHFGDNHNRGPIFKKSFDELKKTYY